MRIIEGALQTRQQVRRESAAACHLDTPDTPTSIGIHIQLYSDLTTSSSHTCVDGVSRALALLCTGTWSRLPRAKRVMSAVLSGTFRSSVGSGLLTAHPQPNSPKPILPPGLHTLEGDSATSPTRSSLLYVPPGYVNTHPTPLIVMLHGAGADARQSIELLQSFADTRNILLLAPTSKRGSWDVISSKQYGPDIAELDRLLQAVFDRCSMDQKRMGIAGFSDGASYALSVGITNGELFSHVLAFSPGFLRPTGQGDTPKIFMSHGVRDRVLPIQNCSRSLYPLLTHAGYPVMYQEFPDGHSVPQPIIDQALDFFLGSPE